MADGGWLCWPIEARRLPLANGRALSPECLHHLWQVRSEMEGKLEAQLNELDRRRSLKYVARTHALAALDPSTHACQPGAMRKGSEWMLASYDKGQREAEAAAAEARRRAAEEAANKVVRVKWTDTNAVHKIDSRYKTQPPLRESKRAKSFRMAPHHKS